MELFDSHCHLDDEKFNEDREKVISNIFLSNITKLISAGYRKVKNTKNEKDEILLVPV